MKAIEKVRIAVNAARKTRLLGCTSRRQGNGPPLPKQLAQIPPDPAIGTDAANGACDTRRGHGAIIYRGADAVLPIR